MGADDDFSFKGDVRTEDTSWTFQFKFSECVQLGKSLEMEFGNLAKTPSSNLSVSRRRTREELEQMKKEERKRLADEIESWLQVLICTYNGGRTLLYQTDIQKFLSFPDENLDMIEECHPPNEEPVVSIVLEDNAKIQSKKSTTVKNSLIRLYSDGTLRGYYKGQ